MQRGHSASTIDPTRPTNSAHCSPSFPDVSNTRVEGMQESVGGEHRCLQTLGYRAKTRSNASIPVSGLRRQCRLGRLAQTARQDAEQTQGNLWVRLEIFEQTRPGDVDSDYLSPGSDNRGGARHVVQNGQLADHVTSPQNRDLLALLGDGGSTLHDHETVGCFLALSNDRGAVVEGAHRRVPRDRLQMLPREPGEQRGLVENPHSLGQRQLGLRTLPTPAWPRDGIAVRPTSRSRHRALRSDPWSVAATRRRETSPGRECLARFSLDRDAGSPPPA